MYLLIGTEADPCIAEVSRLLQSQGDEALVTPEPLAGEGRLAWELQTHQSSSRLRFSRGMAEDSSWQGVLVRASGPWGSSGWDAKDFAYLQAESQAALLGWLGSLPCPVINPARADIWYKPQRSLPEQRVLLARAGLRAPPILITNEPAEARSFAERWGGAISYVPLTSSLVYPIDDEGQWAELDRLMGHMPVCLMEPRGVRRYATHVGGETVWNRGEAVPGREALEAGLARLAALLDVQLLQLELQVMDDEAQCLGFSLHPDFSRHGSAEQEAVAALIVGALKGLKA